MLISRTDERLVNRWKLSWLLWSFSLVILFVLSGCGAPPPIPQDDTISHVEKGFDLYRDGQLDEASIEFTKAIESGTQLDVLAVAYSMRGLIHAETGKLEKALEDYSESIDRDPAAAWVYAGRGDVYVQLEQWEKAIKDYDKAIELDPEQQKAYEGRGLSHMKLGNTEQAIQDFETVLTLNPTHPSASDINQILEGLKSQSTEAIPTEQSGLCAWFVESQFIRATRMSGLTKFISFYQTYGPEGFASQDKTTLAELVGAFEEYLPYEREFIEKWQQLGSTPGAEVFWEKELTAEKQKMSAIEKMIEGIKTEDDALYSAGAELFGQASLIGRESEAAMLEIRENCIKK